VIRRNETWSEWLIKDICVVDWGNTSLTKSTYIDGGEFLAVSAAGCDGRIGHKEHAKHTPVLSAIGAKCGKMFFPDEDFTAIKNTITLTPRGERVDNKFLFYLLNHIKLPQRGAGQPFISKGDIQGFEVCIPGLTEQKRIVAILDDAFERIDTAIANTEKNLANARELFRSVLNKHFNGTTEEYTSLGRITSEITDGDHQPPPKSNEGIPFITISNINKQANQIDFTDTYKVPAAYFKSLKPNRKPCVGDVLYTVTGSFGIPVLVDCNLEFCFQRHIGLLRPKSNVSSRWLYYALMSPFVFRQAENGATGTAQKTVGLKVLREIRVPVMSQSQQVSVVSELDNVWRASKSLESLSHDKLVLLQELKQSLLQKAFSGELTTDFNPDALEH
jgi:type I restriction enzyme S subunit